MMLTIAFNVFVAWATFTMAAASHHGRTLHRVHRIARLVGIAGVIVLTPAILFGAYGLPTGSSWQWFGTTARVGYLGLALAMAGGATWLIADSTFVWQQRRRVFPFVFRRPPGGEG